jgi:hypothetical protein
MVVLDCDPQSKCRGFWVARAVTACQKPVNPPPPTESFAASTKRPGLEVLFLAAFLARNSQSGVVFYMTQLRSDFITDRRPEFYAEPMQAPTRANKPRRKFKTLAPHLRAERAAAWRAARQRADVGRCGDSWQRIDISLPPEPRPSLPAPRAWGRGGLRGRARRRGTG